MPGFMLRKASTSVPYAGSSSATTGRGPTMLIPFVKTKKQDYLQKCSD